jgi:hypothetical protein
MRVHELEEDVEINKGHTVGVNVAKAKNSVGQYDVFLAITIVLISLKSKPLAKR